MVNEIGGVSSDQALANLSDMTDGVAKIKADEYKHRIAQAQAIMKAQNIEATYLNAGSNLYYFTGTQWYASERMVGAILPQKGSIIYIAPQFEVSTLTQYMSIKGEVASRQEHESPYELFSKILNRLHIYNGTIAIDESTAFFIANGIKNSLGQHLLIDAKPVTAGCRMQKSDSEIALLQRAKDMTLAAHQAVASILYEGITTEEVSTFINQAHQKVGAAKGSPFCVVLFGEDTAFPHGVKSPKALEKNDMVLIDTGCQLQGYNSDITRTYVFGEPSQRQREVWQIEKNAQLAAFNAAQIGKPCADVDIAARSYIANHGLGLITKHQAAPTELGTALV